MAKKSLDWVRSRTQKTEAVVKADARYEPFRKEALAILTAQDRTPTPSFRGDGIDNFWQDAKSVRGAVAAHDARKLPHPTSRNGRPSSTSTRWRSARRPTGSSRAQTASRRKRQLCLVSLSDGGKDAVVVREYDTVEKAFVANGFSLPEGKHRIAWLDKDTLLVATDFGAGSLTESGYPFIVKALQCAARSWPRRRRSIAARPGMAAMASIPM